MHLKVFRDKNSIVLLSPSMRYMQVLDRILGRQLANGFDVPRTN